MKIAIVGTGISGHAAALALVHSGHDVSVFEKDNRAGGHAATVDIDYDGRKIAVDTGFIVYNEHNYPNLTAMFDWLDVKTQASDMSFAVSVDDGRFEWCGRDTDVLSGLFAQRRNLLSPSYLLMLREIIRFQRTATHDLRAGSIGDVTLGEYLLAHRFSKKMRDDYLIPMGAAIWSMSPSAMLVFPARTFIAFFDNHRLLQWDRPRWRTVAGGSRNYVAAIGAVLGERLHLGRGVASVRRTGNGVALRDVNGRVEHFDHVIIATHAPEALAMIEDASPQEIAALSPHETALNSVWLHRDPRLMPKRRRAWGAWNFLRSGQEESKTVSVTYWMNMLQSIDNATPLFITLNPRVAPRAELVFGHYAYAHPQFDAGAIAAQKTLQSIQNSGRLSFCGAWTGHGFHEDGLVSGLAAAAGLGAQAPWIADAVRAAAE